MKKNFPITETERNYSEDCNLISTTDLKGQITYANDAFCEVSGFALDELTGQSHNIVRHPDMPPPAFADLWQTLKAGKSWMGMVKNRCKNGDYYWVDAFVTPIKNGAETVEYQSVRTLPDRSLVSRAAAFYRQLNQGDVPRRLRWPSFSLKLRLRCIAMLTMMPLAGYSLYHSPSAASLGLIILSLLLGAGCIGLCLRRFDQLLKSSRGIVDNRLMQYLYTGHTDDISQIQFALRMRQSQLRAVVGRVLDSGLNAEAVAQRSSVAGVQTSTNVEAQQQQLEQVATAMNEMASTTQEMAHNTSAAADAAQCARDIANRGDLVIGDSIAAINALALQLQQALEQIRELNAQGSRIDQVVNVIGDIAAQTNLLALNAAIEAARAGEQGRGFAVVADEVRALAKRTQDSTSEIQAMTKTVQHGTQKAVACIAEGEALSAQCVQKSDGAMAAFREIAEQINAITDMNNQIACAVEEQAAVVDEMSGKVNHINDLARDTSSLGKDTAHLSQQVQERLHQQLGLIEQFMHRSN